MNPSKIFLLIGFVMAGLFGVMGIIVLFFLPRQFQMPDKFRIGFGIVLLLYSGYRFISLRFKQRQEDEERQFR
jgi:hypothetical protein